MSDETFSHETPRILAFTDGKPDTMREVLAAADCVIVPSDYVAQRCIDDGADPAIVVTVHPAIDRDSFNPEGEPADGPEGQPRLLLFAREHDNKRIERAVAACKEASVKSPCLHLVLLGRDQPTGIAHATPVPDDSPAQRARWLRWADALLISAIHDGLATSIGQALATGTPCVAPDHPAVREFLADAWDSVLFDNSKSALTRAITRVADPSTCARLAAPARSSSETFDAKAVQTREAGVRRMLAQKDWPLLSVVLPTYNRADKLGKAVRNVLGQDYPNLELIVVNDGSSDDTATVLAGFNDPRLRIITRENGGLPTALNAGFAEARGKYWTWTSDDNAYHPGALMALARELELDPAAGLVYANMRVVEDNGRERLFQCGPPERLDQHATLGGCFLYRAEVAKRVGEYDPDLYLAEDYDYWLRMRKQTTLRWLPRVLFTYADAADTLTRTRFRAVGDMRLKLLTREFGQRADWPQMKFEHFLHFSALGKNMGAIGASLHNAWRAIRMRPATGAGWRALIRTLTPMPLLRMTRHWRGLEDGTRAT